MHRRILLFALFFLFALLVVVSPCAETPSRALFVSVIENPPVFSSRERIDQLVRFAKESRIKILFVQIYRAGKAWFPSKIADDSFYEKYQKIIREDPFALLIKKAHAKGLEVHAWINLMSLSTNQNAYFIEKYGTDILTRNVQAKSTIEDYKIDHQFYLEPGDPRVGDNLQGIVEEILNNYPDLDGIQFDYIRYPDTKPHYGYTTINTDRFKEATGLKMIDEDSQIWKDWKRAQVTAVLTRLVKTVRSMRPQMQVSTTGCMPYARAYYEAYQDWATWLSTGLIDFVTIMDYSIDIKQFERWIMAIKEKTKGLSKVKISVAAYKLTHDPQKFKNEFTACEQIGAMCAVFYYGSVLESPGIKEFLTTS